MEGRTSAEPSKALAFAALVVGAGNAIGVPWAVFRYGPAAGLNSDPATAMAFIGVAGGTLVSSVAALYGIAGPARAAKKRAREEARARAAASPEGTGAEAGPSALREHAARSAGRLRAAGGVALRKLKAAREA